MLKNLLKYIIIFILGLLVALVTAAFVLKDDIYKEIKKTIASHINAEVDFSDVEVSFLKSFPEVSISIKDLKVIGIDTFESVPLMNVKKLNLDFSLLPFFNKSLPMSLKYMGAENGTINLVSINETTANYLINKPSADTSGFLFQLDKYELRDIDLSYYNQELPLKYTSKNVFHVGSGNFTDKQFLLDTKTTTDSIVMIYDGFTYIHNIKGILQAKFDIDNVNSKYTIKDNSLKLNNLEIKGDGFVQFLNNDDMKVEVKFNTNKQSFANLLSIMPYLASHNAAKASGNLILNGSVNGVFNASKNLFPAFNINLGIDNGFAQYPNMPYPIKNVNGKINISSTKSNMKDLIVNIENFNAEVNNDAVKLNLKIKDGMTDPSYAGNLFADVNLENWSKAIPINELETLTGKINSDLKFSAKQSDIDNQKYANITFNGNLNANNIAYKTKTQPLIKIQNGTMIASPAELSIASQQMTMGSSDMSVNGSLQNPMAWFSENKNIKGKINLVSKNLDLNEWVSKDGATNTEAAVPHDISKFKFSEVEASANIEKLSYGNHIVSNIVARGNLGLENMDIREFKAIYENSDIDMNGKLANVYSYLFNNEILVGEINLNSIKFDANKYMINTGDTKTSVDSLIFEVPANIDLKINTNIKDLLYSNLELQNLKGQAVVKDKAIVLSGLSADLLGGRASFDGLYSSKTIKPDFKMKLDLSKMNFGKSYEKFITMKQLAPLSKYIDGVFNTTLVMEGQLGKGMQPDLSTITISGFIETLNGIIKGFKPLSAVGEKIGVSKFSEMELKDTRNWLEVKNGIVEIKEFSKSYSSIDVKMKGRHKIKGDMDYEMFLRIPRELLKKNIVTSTAEKGWVFLEKEAGKRGVNIAQGEFIDLKVNLSGNLNTPKITIIPLGTSGKSLQEEIKDEVNTKINEVKDSVKIVIENKKKQVEDSIRKRGEEELEKIKSKAEEKATEVFNDAKDKVKKEVESKIDTLIGKEVSDPLKKKAEEVLKDKTGKEVEDIKKKIEDFNPFKKKKKSGGG
ncbi:MAG: hypothetical protein RLZZ546_2174 [Bacteroidota bacterium]